MRGRAPRKFCPICEKRSMKPFGKIQAGPRNGLRRVWKCRNCGYQSLK